MRGREPSQMPHLTAAMAARIGVKDSYPQNRARELFRMAGGTRRYTRFRSLTLRYWLSTAVEMREGSTSMHRAPRSRKRPRSTSRR